jgi:hypothetical protein
MPTYIKTGFWDKKAKAPDGWLDLNQFVQTLIPPPPPSTNIYNSDGTITGPRDVFCSQHNLRFREVNLVRFDNILFSNSFVIDFSPSQEKIYTRYNNNDIGLKLDFANQIYGLGDFSLSVAGTQFYCEDANQTIYSKFGGNITGFSTKINNTKIGDFGNLVDYMYFEVDNNTSITKTIYGGNDIGLKLDFANTNQLVQLGDITSGNQVNLQIDSLNQTLTFNKAISDNLLRLDFASNTSELGNTSIGAFISVNQNNSVQIVGGQNNNTRLAVDDQFSLINTQYNGNDIGLKLDFAGDLYQFGNTNNCYLNIDDANGDTTIQGINNTVIQATDLSTDTSFIKLQPNNLTTNFNSNDIGLKLDFANDIYQFGQLTGGNTTQLKIDDAAAFPVQVSGTNVSSSTSGAASGQFLNVKVNGVDYKIALLNP